MGVSTRRPAPAGDTATDPSVAGVATAFPPARFTQHEAIRALTDSAGPDFRRVTHSGAVEFRDTAWRPARSSEPTGFGEANDAYLEVALDLGERALLAALDEAKVKPGELDVVFTTTAGGLAVPALEARLARRIGLRPDITRVPLSGQGCAAGAAGVARLHDYLRAFPDDAAALLAVELCSLTVHHRGGPAANTLATSFFGDGAAAVVAEGAHRAGAERTGPRVLASRSRIYPDIEEVPGWQIGGDGFRAVLSADVATIVENYLGDDVREFLADHGLNPRDVTTWICHPGGPRVIEAVEDALGLPARTFDHTRKSLRDNTNLSSVSVLDALRTTMADPPSPGSLGLMIAMGPASCTEVVLLAW